MFNKAASGKSICLDSPPYPLPRGRGIEERSKAAGLREPDDFSGIKP